MLSDGDSRTYDQNLMCMRSGLVIKTAPVLRPSLSSRLQLDYQTRGPRELSVVPAVAATSRPQQPASPVPVPSSVADTRSSDPSDSATGSSSSNGMAKTGAGRSCSVTRPRSLDFMSIVTRFQLARRAKTMQLGNDAGTPNNLLGEDWMLSAVQLDFYPDDNSRRTRPSRTASEPRSPTAESAAERRALRRRRRRSQFASAAAAALQAAVSRAAAAAVVTRPRFVVSPRGVASPRLRAAPPHLRPHIQREREEPPTLPYLARAEDSETEPEMFSSGEPGFQQTSSTGSSTCGVQPVTVTPSHRTASAVSALVDMSRQNYIYLQPYMPDNRSSTAATGSLTDLFGRVAAMPESQTTDSTGQVVVNRPLTSSAAVSVIVSKMGSVPPAQPVAMFKIIGGPGISGSQAHNIVAYRHRPTQADQQPVLLPASAVRTSSGLPGLAVRQSSSSATELLDLNSTYPLKLLAQRVSAESALPEVVPQCVKSPVGIGREQLRLTVSSPGSYDVEVGRTEAEAHELTRDASGREIHRCRLCARIFTVMAAFRSHVLTTHCRPKNQCAICGKHFSRSWLLKGHMRTHTGERPYRCPHAGCDRAFADKSNLRSHLLIHNANGKHYVCTRCNRAFAQKRYLHKHRLEVCKI